MRAADLLPNRVDVQLKAGALLLVSGRYDDAKVRADKALAIAPKDVDAHILLSNALAGQTNVDAAIAEAEEAIRLEPTRAGAYANLGELEARRAVSSPRKRPSRRRWSWTRKPPLHVFALVSFYWNTNRRAEAERELTQTLALDPNNVAAHRAMATLTAATNRPTEAEAHLKKVIELTKSQEAVLALADFYITHKDQQSARNVLEPLTTTAQPSVDANMKLVALDRASGRSKEAYARVDGILAKDSTQLQALLAKSAMLLEDGKRDEALAAAQQAVQSHPDSAEAFIFLGGVQAARGQPDAAIAAYKDALKINPRASAAHVALAQLSLKTGRASEAVGFAEDALTSNPANADARLALARSLIAKGELARAETELAQLARQFPNSTAVHTQTGVLLARKRDLAGARRELDQALKLDPSSTEAVEASVALDLAMKQPDAARARAKTTADNPNASPSLLLVAGRTYVATGDAKTGEQLIRQALQKDPNYLAAYLTLGQLYLSRNRLDAALTEFDQVLQRDPKQVATLTTTGTILLGMKRTAEARSGREGVGGGSVNAGGGKQLAWIYAELRRNMDERWNSRRRPTASCRTRPRRRHPRLHLLQEGSAAAGDRSAPAAAAGILARQPTTITSALPSPRRRQSGCDRTCSEPGDCGPTSTPRPTRKRCLRASQQPSVTPISAWS